MKHKCDKCDKPATIYLTEIDNGAKTEKHLCEDCAAAEGITIKANPPISELLEDLVMHSAQAHLGSPGAPGLKCEVCGLEYSEFRRTGLLGCPNDYDAFAPLLEPLIAGAQGGQTVHVGKVPARAGPTQQKQTAMLRLRGQLRNAVAAEDYEIAAGLRDQLRELENA
jgi:protein arginine kinase activator